MLTKQYEYHLPEEAIAQTPVEPRDSSRLLVIDRGNSSVSDRLFSDITDYFTKGDLLILNNTKVIGARLPGKLPSGGKCEVFLLKDLGGNSWEALVNPGRKMPVGSRITIGSRIQIEIISQADDGARIIKFENEEDVKTALYDIGQVPLPPYIKTPITDPSRYQTIYASVEGSVAAPTAALHFTAELLDKIQAKGVSIGLTTLHMGLGSFRPIKAEDLDMHVMPEEYVQVPADVAEMVNRAKKEGRRVVACGTDVIRTLETAATGPGKIEPFSGPTRLFIKPGYKFKIIDMVITNLHLPRSSHLVLVSTFADIDLVRRAYSYAIDKKFRFYTFGDATLII